MIHQRIDWGQIEKKWQKRWSEAKIFDANPDPKTRKAFVTFPFAYMNGPLHVGHGFTATKVDAYARFMRMQQYNVLFPWAWHWTGETIAGASERVKNGDPAMIREFREIDGVSEDDLRKFVDPTYIAKYYTEQNMETVKRTGFSIDWRREFHTTSLEPNFSRYVEWQYNKLRERNYVIMGTHPVVWCPHCESPTGDHDRLEGEGVSPEEYVLMKFRFDDAFLVAATLRPETIFGVTNLWISPEADYVHAKVDEEVWIISRQASDKLREQLRSVEILRSLKGSELIGRSCKDLVANRALPILPGWFVDPNSASGVVYSVPAHAPFDWIALRDLKAKPELAERFGVSIQQLEEIKPVGIISLEGHGEFPAIEIVDQIGVKDQNDPKCEEVTKIVYKKEFHTGILKANCGEYAGMKVRDAKDTIIRDFKLSKIVDSMLDLPQPVVCRCTTLCRVKTLEGQWFLRYSDDSWKQRTKLLLSRANVYPETARQWFLDVIDWYRDWPCARKTGLGTPLPWSPEWIVETLSDSTVYMAFYTINAVIRERGLLPEQLTDEVFDYVFLGIGTEKTASKKSGIKPEILGTMREEFLYWYPVDLRVSAKELLPNHLTFFLFQHAALFKEEHWPRGIGVNGMLMMEGQKMSKSKGNIVTLRRAIEEHGADVTRCALLLGADDMDDPDWRVENLRDVSIRLESFMNLAKEITATNGDGLGHLEDWLTSRMHQRILDITENMRRLRTRAAAENTIYQISNDFRWYVRRRRTANRKVALSLLDAWVRLMAPFAPHLSEEIWESLGKGGFVSKAQWPKPEEFKKFAKAEIVEEEIRKTIEDVNDIIQVTEKIPKQIILYTASDWKWQVFLRLVKERETGSEQTRTLMKGFASDPKMKNNIKNVAKYIEKVSKEVSEMSTETRGRLLEAGVIEELEALQSSREFLSKELKAEIKVYGEDDELRFDPAGRAGLAKPIRPAIYVE